MKKTFSTILIPKNPILLECERAEESYIRTVINKQTNKQTPENTHIHNVLKQCTDTSDIHTENSYSVEKASSFISHILCIAI